MLLVPGGWRTEVDMIVKVDEGRADVRCVGPRQDVRQACWVIDGNVDEGWIGSSHVDCRQGVW